MIKEVGGENVQEIIENPDENPDLADASAEANPDQQTANEVIGYAPTPSNVGPQQFERDYHSWELEQNYEISK